MDPWRPRREYIISAHSTTRWNQLTTIPAHVSVRFYRRFGEPMDSPTGYLLHAALAKPAHPPAAAILKQYPQRTQWQGPGLQRPGLDLTGDDDIFYKGIVDARTNTLVEHIGPSQLTTLGAALATIRLHAGDQT